MNIFEHCPGVESESFLLRLVTEQDCGDLLKVYSDEAAVPLFNSDNCNGDDFHYTTAQRMLSAIQFWIWSYDNGWFVRCSVVEKKTAQAIGTVELCLRPSEDCSILRIDLRSDYENEAVLSELLERLIPICYEWFGCGSVITKAKPIARERIRVLKAMGFVEMEQPLLGHDGTQYWDYFLRKKA